MSESTQEIFYQLLMGTIIAALIYGLYRFRRWAAAERTMAAADLDRFTARYGLQIDQASKTLRGAVDGVDLVIERSGVRLVHMGKGGIHSLIRVTARGDRPQRWLLCARFIIEKMSPPLPEAGRQIEVLGNDKFNQHFLLLAESEDAVPFLAAPPACQALLDSRLRLASADGKKLELSFDHSAIGTVDIPGNFDELEGALRTTLSVCLPERTDRYLSTEPLTPDHARSEGGS